MFPYLLADEQAKLNHRVLKTDLPRKLNVGCGLHHHARWCNVDLVSIDPQVLEHDIRQGLPFPDNYFEAVYHSHVLEHLTPRQGEQLLRECRRVLQPRGVLRIVVPDLEQIARLYLETLQDAWTGDREAAENYEWMKLELLDQMVRHQSGGLMGPYMIDSRKINRTFVQSRVGVEVESCQSIPRQSSATGSRRHRGASRGWLARFRNRLAHRAVRMLLGQNASEALREGLFRQQGEIHRWMYDRHSLQRLCTRHGFTDFQICRADESRIEGFADFQLDQIGDQIRKPDSLFVECRKAAVAAVRVA